MGYAALCGIARQVGKGAFCLPGADLKCPHRAVVSLRFKRVAGDVAITPEKVSRLLYTESLNCFLQLRARSRTF